MRLLSCADLDYLGIDLDPKKNEIRSKEIREIQQTDASVKILVIPTNEELEIAKQSHALLKNSKKA
jgi:acetate kinase